MRELPTTLLLLLLLALAPVSGCEPSADGPDTGAAASGTTDRPVYVREYVFVGSRGGQTLAAPFVFRAMSDGEGIHRVARVALAQGASWERVLEESWQSPAAAGMWRVLPRGELRVAAQGGSEVEALWIAHADRPVRLQLGMPISGWTQGTDARFRVHQGRLTLGEEVTAGAVLQLLSVNRATAGGKEAEPSDWIFLSGGDSLRLVLARLAGAPDRFGTSFGWTGRADEERSWEMVEISWLEQRPVRQGGHEVPVRWGFRIPEAGIDGQLQALGMDVEVGDPRGGRSAVEVHYTVAGWVEIDGRRSQVRGVVRHSRR